MADKKEENEENQTIMVDYQMAIQNLTDILIDDEKFSEMMKNIYDAIDTDNEGVLPKVDVDEFTRNFLRGKQIEGQINTDFESKHKQSFQILKDIESDYINTEELSFIPPRDHNHKLSGDDLIGVLLFTTPKSWQ